MTSGLLRAVRARSFLLLWSGQTISRLGDSLYRFALVWWVLQTTGSGFAMSVIVICQTLPKLLFLLVGGVAVDRFNRVRIMLVSDLGRGSLIAIVSALAFTGRLELWHADVAALVFGFVDAFFQPAYAAVVPAIVPRDDLPSANALTMLSAQLTNIGGPAAGAVIVAFGGTAVAFAANAASFFASAACLVPLLRLRVQSPAAEPTATVLDDVRKGIGFVIAEPWLWITIAFYAISNATDTCAFAVTLPFLIARTMHLDADALGFVQSLFSVGAVAGAIWMGRRARLHHRGRVLYGISIGVGLGMILFGLPITLVGIAAIALVRGIGLSVEAMIWTDTLQEMVPGETLGRVSSIDSLGSNLLMPIGFAVVGWATDHYSPSLIFIAIGALTAVLSALALVHPRVRRLD